MVICNRIAEVAEALIDPTTQAGPAWRRRLPHDIDSIVVHRVSVTKMEHNLSVQTHVPPNIVQLARLSRRLPELGRKLAYPLLVLADGSIEQGLPLSYVSPHAGSSREWIKQHGNPGWNRRSIAVAAEGDFRKTPPTAQQLASLHWLLPLLRIAYCRSPKITAAGQELPCLLAHGEAVGGHDGSKAPGRHDYCPGQYLDIQALRAHCESEPATRAREELDGEGLVFA